MKRMMRGVLVGFAVLLSLLSAGVLASSGGGEAPKPEGGYMELHPPFVVNYGGKGRLRFLRAEVALRLDGGNSAVEHHMPVIRDKIVMLLTKQSVDAVLSMEGRELLRQEALEAVRAIITAEEGEQKIKDLYFTSFVTQN